MPGLDQVGERPLEEMVQKASQEAVALAREQVDVARRELAARVRQAGPGAAMVSGGVLLGALASGTGTAALILSLARRQRASAAALGVTGAYAGAGALLARGGLARLRQAGPRVADEPVQDEPIQNAKQDAGSAEQRTRSAAKSPRATKSAANSARRTTSAAKSRPEVAGRLKPASKTASSHRRAPGRHAGRPRQRAS